MTSKVRIDFEARGTTLVKREIDGVGDSAEDAGDDLEKMAKDAGFLDKRIGDLRGELKGLISDFDKTGDADLLKKIGATNRELGQINRLKTQMGALAGETRDKVAPAAKKASDGLEQFGYSAKVLDQRIMILRGSLRAMAQQFSQTGDVDILKRINKGKGDLDELTALRKKLTGLLDVAADGGKRFGEELTKSLIALKGPALGALAVVAAAAAPFLGGVIASAVLGGTGAGGIIGGLVLAAQDARVQDAGTQLAERAMSAFTSSAEPFVKPALDAMMVLEDAADDVSHTMREAFDSVALALVPLTRGLAGLVKEMMPGLVDAMKGARPVLLVIGAELPKIGRALSNFLSTIARDPRGAIIAFQDLSRIIQGTIVILGRFLLALSTLWSKISPIIRVAQGDVVGMAVDMAVAEQAMADARNAAESMAGGLEDVGGAADKTQTEIISLNDAIDGFIGRQLNADQAAVSWRKGLRELNEELREGKRTLSLNTEEGLRNREAVLGMIGEAERLRDIMFKQTGDIGKANEAYQANIQTLYNMGLAAGFSRKELDALFAPYINGPRIAETEFRFPGLLAGLEAARELARLTGSYSSAARERAGDKSGYGGGRASGGPVMAGQTYLVGERGPELLQMGSTNGYVHNASATAAMMSGASGGSSHIQIVFQSDGMRLINLFHEVIREIVRVKGRGSVDVAFT